ncbi:hypothetical protein BH10PAT1_BH10PAT1_5190 [soil metagenome]
MIKRFLSQFRGGSKEQESVQAIEPEQSTRIVYLVKFQDRSRYEWCGADVAFGGHTTAKVEVIDPKNKNGEPQFRQIVLSKDSFFATDPLVEKMREEGCPVFYSQEHDVFSVPFPFVGKTDC